MVICRDTQNFPHRDAAIASVLRLPNPIEMTAFALGDFEQVLGRLEAGRSHKTSDYER